MQPPRQVVVLHMLVLALRDYPDATWDQAAQLACEFGHSLASGPVRPAEVHALRDLTIGQLVAAVNTAAAP